MRALAIILWHRMIFVVFISIILCLATSLRGHKLSASHRAGYAASRSSDHILLKSDTESQHLR